MFGRIASVEGARAERVTMIGSVVIDLIGVEAGVRGSHEAERQTKTGGRKSKPTTGHREYIPT